MPGKSWILCHEPSHEKGHGYTCSLSLTPLNCIQLRADICRLVNFMYIYTTGLPGSSVAMDIIQIYFSCFLHLWQCLEWNTGNLLDFDCFLLASTCMTLSLFHPQDVTVSKTVSVLWYTHWKPVCAACCFSNMQLLQLRTYFLTMGSLRISNEKAPFTVQIIS